MQPATPHRIPQLYTKTLRNLAKNSAPKWIMMKPLQPFRQLRAFKAAPTFVFLRVGTCGLASKSSFDQFATLVQTHIASRLHMLNSSGANHIAGYCSLLAISRHMLQ